MDNHCLAAEFKRPARPGDAVAWGRRDGDKLPIWTEEGLWFVINLADEASPSEALCYFIGSAEGPVKIGYSINVERRLKGLQLACPVVLSVLAICKGGEVTEASYHQRFAAHRLHGEWFERVPEIVDEIERLNARRRKSV